MRSTIIGWSSATTTTAVSNYEYNALGLQSKETKDKIITNTQALSEEISHARYLIEYMNNNNKKQIL